jgi:uncharacterized protein YndB with AHSA1/START domain
MDAKTGNNLTTMKRTSDRETLVTRTVNAPARIVFEAWTKAELFQKWWAPKSYGLTILSCDMDVRTGGSYRLVMKHPQAPEPMAFFGKYLEVTPHSRVVWTNDEAGEGGPVTTLTLEEKGGKTLVTMHELYSSKEALDAELASGAKDGFSETFEQLDELLVTLGR